MKNSEILMEKAFLLGIIIFERKAFYMIKVTLTNEILSYITYKRLTEKELNTFIEMRSDQLREEGTV